MNKQIAIALYKFSLAKRNELSKMQIKNPPKRIPEKCWQTEKLRVLAAKIIFNLKSTFSQKQTGNANVAKNFCKNQFGFVSFFSCFCRLAFVSLP